MNGNLSVLGSLGTVGVTTLGDHLNVGTSALQQQGQNANLKVYGNTTLNGTLTVLDSLTTVGVTTLGDDLNVGTDMLQQQGDNANLNVYGDATIKGNIVTTSNLFANSILANGANQVTVDDK